MNRTLIGAVVLGFALYQGAANAAGALQVQLAEPSAKTDFATGKIQFTVANTGADPVRVLRWQTPLDDSLGGLTANLFQIEDLQGQPARYVGKLAKRAAPTAADYIVLQPGQSRTVTLDLSSDYDLSQGGQYHIRYLRPLEQVVEAGDAQVIRQAGLAQSATVQGRALDGDAVASNTLNLWVNGGPRPLDQALQQLRATPLASAANSFVSCSSTRQTQLVTARNSAVTYASNAKSYLDAGTQGSRYTWWFGTYNSSRYSTVRSHFTNIASALSTADYTFDCSCTESGTYAYVYPDQPYRVYLCGAFWSASNTGTDSRAGTLIHETSHFNVVAGTDDHVYGQSGAHSLATSNPANAVDNADNHEYFGENTPARN